MSELLCFETESLRRQFQRAFPEECAQACTVEELVARELGEKPAVPSRLALTEAQAETIAGLRRALVLTQDDADFAFASLPATPRNRELRRLLGAYLDSEAADDTTARLWRLVEAIKNFQVDAPASHLVFVRAAESAPLFADLANAYRGTPSAESVELVESWQWRPPNEPAARARPLVALRGTAPALLEALGAHAAHAWRRGRRVRIAFSGEERERAFLKAFLHHRRVPFRVADETPDESPTTATPFAALVTALRHDNGRDLKARLKFLALLQGDIGNRRHPADGAALRGYLERFVKLKELPPDDLVYLTSLVDKTPSAPALAAEPEAPRGILLLPFHPLPAEAGSTTLYYAGRDALTAPRRASLFAESEAEALHRAGFPYPRASEMRARTAQELSSLVEPAAGRRFLFTRLPEASLPFRVRFHDVRRETTVAPEEPSITLPDLPKRSLSATQLEKYAECPAAYFFSYRLKYRRFQSGEDTYALLFGQAVHATLERYFKAPTREAADLPKLFTQVLHDLAPALEADLPLATTLRAHFARLARRLPEIEGQLTAVEGKATPKHLERAFELAIEDVRLVGKIDRVDERDDGSWVVLDYKTGAVDFTPDHVGRGLNFQALVYLLAAESLTEKPCAGVIFYDLKKGEVRRGMLREDVLGTDAKKMLTRGHVMPLEKFARLKEEGVTRLRALATEIAAGHFPATPDAERCGRCDYVLYCRRSAAHE